MDRRSTTLAIVTGITLLGLVLPSAASAKEPWYSVYRNDHREWTLAVTGGFSLLDLDGDVTLDENLGDTDISLDSVLDLKEFESFWGEVDLMLFRGQHLRFGYTPLRLDSSEILSQQITVDGETYDIGDLVDSKIKLDQYELSFRSDFWIGDYLSLGPVIQLSLVDAKVRVENETAGLSESESAWLPLPYLGLRADVYPLSRLQIFVEGKGMTIGSPATIWQLDAGLAVHLTRNLSLMGRYRISDYEVEYSDTEVNLNLAGPQVGATLRF